MTNYLKTSYELYQSDAWFSRRDLLSNGAIYSADNPLLVMQTIQLDINGDGLADIFTYDTYPLNVPTPNPPPSIFINKGIYLEKVAWTGPAMGDPHGVKILIGDFNHDGLPDLFSLVAVDPPNGAFPTLKDFNNLLLNSPTGFNTVKEFTDQLGFWYAGASGDIDNDGDLDVVMFNFHVENNGVTSKILWNDGKANFTYDSSGIGSIPLVDQAELVDINGDGLLDLVIDHIDQSSGRQPIVSVMWGNGHGFSGNHATSFKLESNQFASNLSFVDLDKDGTQEIIVSGSNSNGQYWVELFKSTDAGQSFIKRTAEYFDKNISTVRFDHLRLTDVDHDGSIDLFAPDRQSNIRWEWDGKKFAKIGASATWNPAETISAQDGNEAIDGGAGIDTVNYTNTRSEYTISKTVSGFAVTDVAGAGGTDTLSNIERLHFANVNVALDTSGIAGEAYRLYKAAFDRTPDLTGLGYWIKQMDNGYLLKNVAKGFIASAEFQTMYGANSTDQTFVRLLYNHVLARDPDQGGYDYWLNQMSHGMTRETVLINFSDSTENITNVAELVAVGIPYMEWLG